MDGMFMRFVDGRYLEGELILYMVERRFRDIFTRLECLLN